MHPRTGASVRPRTAACIVVVYQGKETSLTGDGNLNLLCDLCVFRFSRTIKLGALIPLQMQRQGAPGISVHAKIHFSGPLYAAAPKRTFYKG